MAVLCGLNVAQSRFEKFGKKSCFLSKRFDRFLKDGNIQRIHFSSAMTQTSKTDGNSNTASYLDIANFLRTSGSDPKNDLEELWNRIVFNIAVSNTDDHLRNHGFLLTNQGWKLSPLYDITPNPYKNELSLNITENDNSKSLKLALKTCSLYGLSVEKARLNVEFIQSTVQENWQPLAKKYGIPKNEQEFMKNAF